MKKQFLLAFGLASMLLAGCSDSDNVADGGNTPDPNAKSYLSLRLNLPTSTGSGSRADENFKNDQFDTDRLVSDEYKVNTVKLVCFRHNSGTGKDEITGTYDITSLLNWANGSETGITTEAVLPVTSVASDTKKVLVLVNAPDGKLTLSEGTSFEKFNTALVSLTTQDLIGSSKNNFFMTNAPLSDGKGTTVLVDIDPQTSPELAMANQRDIYVERAVGKVTLTHQSSENWTEPSDFWMYKISDGKAYAKDEITIKSWAIDNYNTTMYPVRKYAESATTWEALKTGIAPYEQRFFGALKYHGNKYYTASSSLEGRTYWAEDPNYSGADQLQTLSSLADFASGTDLKASQYCLENTFNVNAMIEENTTSVLIRAIYKPNGMTAGETWFRLANSNTAYSFETLENRINKELNLTGDQRVKIKNGTEYGYSAGDQVFVKDMFKDGEAGTNAEITDAQVSKLNANLGKLIAYLNGVCYYRTLIKHFGSAYTPWGSESKAPEIGTIGNFYNYATLSDDTQEDLHYLGRYGIVRNNWYQLELGTITAPGSPTIPELSTKADDEQKYYIQATVKIMDWAVRKQSVNL